MSKLAFENPDVNSLADQLEDFLISHESTLTFFKQSASGPEVMGDNYLPFVTEDPDPYRELYRIGSFYCVAIGQGSYYHAGLFGPLPVLGSEYRAIVFSTLVEDDQTFDQRMKGWNYLISCFFFHESLLPRVHQKRDEIEALFEFFFHKRSKLAAIKEQNIQKLKQALLLIIQE